MGLSHTVSEIKRQFQPKIKKFPTPGVFCDPAEGVPLGIWYRCWGQKTRVMATGMINKFDDIFSHLDTMHQRDRRTDAGRQQRPHLRIASRSKY